MTQSADGCRVTLKCMILRRACSMMKKRPLDGARHAKLLAFGFAPIAVYWIIKMRHGNWGHFSANGRCRGSGSICGGIASLCRPILEAKASGNGTGFVNGCRTRAIDGAAGRADRFFQRCLAKSRGATPAQRREWRRGIYEQIEVMQSQGVLTIEEMCRASGVSLAGFYRDWEQKAPDQAAMALRDAIQRASLEHPRYGGAKVVEVLRRAGWVVSLTQVQRVRRDDNLLAVRRRKFVVTTDSDHEFLVYPNLAQYMVLSAVNQLWVADITYLRLASEFAYFRGGAGRIFAPVAGIIAALSFRRHQEIYPDGVEHRRTGRRRK